MTATETIREAARLMRERATSATNLPGEHWTVDVSPDSGLIVGSYAPGDVSEDGTRSTACIAYFAYPGDEEQRTYAEAFAVATHMASWQPLVAATVADLLDHAADDIEAGRRKDWHTQSVKALAIARAYLADDQGGTSA
ncbi:hypothetical protein ABZ749_01135 [Micromonospora sp. NPDC047753]|uniref:hypothetical protein n=1 Tax=Micromonospora sp. NPDC047753 TaxID=3154817 RepID=UPI00340F4426